MSGPLTNPYRTFAFTVEIDGIQVAGFRKVSGLSVEMEPEEYEEGGVNSYVHTLPGQYSHGNLVLEQGLSKSTKLWNWMKKLRAGELYAQDTDARKTVRVVLHAKSRSQERRGWQFRNAYPVKWEGPELTAGASGGSAVAIQRLELAHQGFTETSR